MLNPEFPTLVEFLTKILKSGVSMAYYIIYCDESIKKGKYFSNFYGGAIINSHDLDNITRLLEKRKTSLNLFGEIKWSKISDQYYTKYIEIVNFFFEFIKAEKVKIRIMFTQNYRPATDLTEDQIKNEYFLLYYQFFKHAFGFQYCPPSDIPLELRVYFDKFPANKDQIQNFRNYIHNLQDGEFFKPCQIVLKMENIIEVVSHNHVILQCMDIILGAMQFRLNDMHKIKDPTTNKRGKKTKAKEKVYKCIYENISEIRPRFNIGVSTSLDNNIANRWNMVYSHWLFTPSNHSVDQSKAKNR
jgi:hypothetical protein